MRRLISEDLELGLRLLLALVIGAAIAVACFGGLAWMLTQGEWFIVYFVVCLTIAGLSATRAHRDLSARAPDEGDRHRLESAVHRLALVAGIPAPRAVVEQRAAPLSWAQAMPGSQPAVHVTTGLLDRLEDPELEAVVAHELAHVRHRDALAMTLLAAAPAAFLTSVRKLMVYDDWQVRAGVLLVTAVAIPPALLLLLTARIASRHRELIADRAAAVLTGSPAAVAGALVTLSEGLAKVLDRDLREVSPADVFHFLPARPPRPGTGAWATHPRLEDRLARLQRMESAMQRGRRP